MEASDATSLLQKMLVSELQKSTCSTYRLFPLSLGAKPLETTACNFFLMGGPQLWSQDPIKALQIFTPVLLVLARTEFNFSTVACVMLCFGFVTKAVLVRLRGMF